MIAPPVFLSRLFGVQLNNIQQINALQFLSRLFGVQPANSVLSQRHRFLSRLFGVQPAPLNCCCVT